MDIHHKPLSHAHLHAFADRILVDRKRVDVSDFVKTHPNLIIYIRDYQFINEQLHKLYDRVLDEPIPERLLATVKNHGKKASHTRQILMMIVTGMILGGIIGVILHQTQSTQMVRDALSMLQAFITRLF